VLFNTHWWLFKPVDVAACCEGLLESFDAVVNKQCIILLQHDALILHA
jgi:hypothetical protein